MKLNFLSKNKRACLTYLSAAIGIVIILSLGGCASVPMAEKSEGAEAKRFEPVADSAKLYVFRRDRLFAKALAFDVFLDGRVFASTVSGSFCVAILPPGEHTLSSQHYGGARQLKINVRSGQIYYIEQIPRASMSAPFTDFISVEEQDARRIITKIELVKSNL